MSLILFYDSETSGMPDWGSPSEAPHQPHIVQLAALLVDADTRNTVGSMDVIVRPDGWTIPDDVAAIHGITTEHANDVGIPERVAILMFMELWYHRPRVAHNEQFDARIIRIALMRYQNHLVEEWGKPLPDVWKEGRAECTARLSRPICALPKSKVPTLTEAYRHFTGKTLEDAHSAMGDARACADVYFAIKEFKHEQERNPSN